MRYKIKLTKKDVLVGLACVLFLLVNIAAIGSGGRKRAKEAVCMSNLHEWGEIFMAYLRDNYGYFHTEWGGPPEHNGWMKAMMPYYDYIKRGSKGLSTCPAANKDDPTDPWGGTFTTWGPWVFYGTALEEMDRGSYGINMWCTNPPEASHPDSNWNWTGSDTHIMGGFWAKVNFWRTPNVAGAANIPLFLDSAFMGGIPDTTNPPDLVWAPDLMCYSAEDQMKTFALPRHNGGINSVFMDWSVRKVGVKQLWTFKWHRNSPIPGPYTLAGGFGGDDWPEWMREFKDF